MTTQQDPRSIVRRAAVLGAGTMGAQIAALLANQGIPVDLLDLPSRDGERNAIAEAGKQRLLKLAPPPLYDPGRMDLISVGNFDDDLERLREADWVVEAVTERLDIKQELWGKAGSFIQSSAIASSNTSGIPIASISEALPQQARSRFLGTHFFNPPRYLRLLEVTPTGDTDPFVADTMIRFAEHVLGKGVVRARDVPNFVGNRIGCYGFMVTLREMEQYGFGFDDVDAITGPVMGRPNSATFRTLDIVGIDVFAQICDNMVGFVQEEWERQAYAVPQYIRDALEKGWAGDKVGQGFFKRVRDAGGSQILVLDPTAMDYRPRRRLQADSLSQASRAADIGERLRTLVAAKDDVGNFSWKLLSQLLVYSARKVGEVADDVVNIDRAMEWGFGWEVGPFASWDALGVADTVKRMESDGLEPPDWVVDMARRGETFHRHEPERSLEMMPGGGYGPVAEPERTIPWRRVLDPAKEVASNPGAGIYDLGDGVAYFDFHSPKQAIDHNFNSMAEQAAEILPGKFKALIIGAHVAPNFCVGANVALMLDPVVEGKPEQADDLIRRFQYSLLGLKRLGLPVVVAPYGATVGGGAEIVLAGDRVVAFAETALGLVEIGAGVVPAGGGCKELLLRAMASAKTDEERGAALGRVFETIALAKTSRTGYDAVRLGFLRHDDIVVSNPDHQIHAAKEAALALATSYRPPAPARIPVMGEPARKALEAQISKMVEAGDATEHDGVIARKLAYVLTGGDATAGTEESEEHFLELERAALMELAHTPKSQDRLASVKNTGRPLRN